MFSDAFFFSIQTMATIGYGVLYPTDLYTNLLVTAETLVALIVLALATGLLRPFLPADREGAFQPLCHRGAPQ